MKRWCIWLACITLAADHYELTGHLDRLEIYQHADMLLLKHIQKLELIEQPLSPTHSYLSDISTSDAVIHLKPQSYCLVKQHKTLKIDCYDQSDDQGKFHILLDAGHGGKDMGAIAASGLKEKHVTLSYTQKLAQYLDYPWVKVELTRKEDIYLDKYDRLRRVLQTQPDLLLSIHADAYTEPQASGVGLFHLDESQGSRLSQTLIASYADRPHKRSQSAQFANGILERLQGQYKLHNDKSQGLPLVILRSPITLSMLLELGFLSNPEEASYLASENYLEGFAEDMSEILLSLWKAEHGILYTASVD